MKTESVFKIFISDATVPPRIRRALHRILGGLGGAELRDWLLPMLVNGQVVVNGL